MRSYREPPRYERVASGLGDPRCGPGRIPHDVDPYLLDARLSQETLAHVVEDELGGRTAHRGEGEVDVYDSSAFADPIDDAEVDEIYRHLRILDLRERGPEALEHDSWRCAFGKLGNSSWNVATIWPLRGPRSRQRRRPAS